MTEETMIKAHQAGRQEYHRNPGLSLVTLAYNATAMFYDAEDRDSYVAGFIGERRRARGNKI